MKTLLTILLFILPFMGCAQDLVFYSGDQPVKIKLEKSQDSICLNINLPGVCVDNGDWVFLKWQDLYKSQFHNSTAYNCRGELAVDISRESVKIILLNNIEVVTTSQLVNITVPDWVAEELYNRLNE